LAQARLLLKEEPEPQEREGLQAAVAALEEALQSADRDRLKQCKDDLLDALYELEE